MREYEQELNLLTDKPDSRKKSYILYLATTYRESWHHFFSHQGRSYSPSVFRLQKAEGLLVKISDETHPNNRRRLHKAPEHTLTVMAATLALARLISTKTTLEDSDIHDVVLAASVHDANKDIESQATRMVINDAQQGFGQKGYDLAGTISIQKLRFAGAPENIIALHGMVGHASCPKTEEILDGKTALDQAALLQTLILHYVDDVTTNPNIIDPKITFDDQGGRLNALDRRCIQNERNQAYEKYNLAWKSDSRNKTGETAFQMQRRVGHKVEEYLANILHMSDPLLLPQMISDQMEKEILAHWQKVHGKA